MTGTGDSQDPDVQETGCQARAPRSLRDQLLSALTTIFVAVLTMAACFAWGACMAYLGFLAKDGFVESVVALGPPALLVYALVRQGDL